MKTESDIYGQCVHGENMANCDECEQIFKPKKKMNIKYTPIPLLDKVKDEIAKEEGYDSWIDFKFKENGLSLELIMDKVAERYAKSIPSEEKNVSQEEQNLSLSTNDKQEKKGAHK